MNTYVPDFGPLNTMLLSDLLSSYESHEPEIITNNIISHKRSYVVTLNYDKGDVAFEKIFVTNSSAEEVKDGEEYIGKIFSFEGDLLSTFNFLVPNEWFISSDLEKTSGNNVAKPARLNHTFNLPYFEDGETLEVYNNQDKKVASLMLAPFAETCGDKVCQDQEDYLSCMQDCSMAKKDGICLPYYDQICDPDCPIFGDMKDQECTKDNIIIMISSIIIFISIVFVALKFPNLRKAI